MTENQGGQKTSALQNLTQDKLCFVGLIFLHLYM